MLARESQWLASRINEIEESLNVIIRSIRNASRTVLAAAGTIAFAVGASAAQPAAAPAAAAKPATILVVGASGMIGSRVVQEAASRGHQVIGAARNPDKIARHANVRAVKLDATDQAAFTALARDADVIVSATSPRGGGDPIKEARGVGDAAMAAAQAAGKRLIVVGGAGSLNLPDGKPVLDTLPGRYRGEAAGMRAVLDTLKTSNVEWTFFSPASSISPGTRTGKYQLGTTTLLSDAQGKSHISAEDFAKALVDEIEKPAHIRSQMTIAY
jgi:putative NADH-flavin reductase